MTTTIQPPTNGHSSSLPAPTPPTIDRASYHGFEFTSTSSSISPSAVIDSFADRTGIHCPEMPYFENSLLVRHIESGIEIRLNTSEALLACQSIYNQQQQQAEGKASSDSKEATDDNAADLTASLPIPAAIKVTASDKWSTTKLQSTLKEAAEMTPNLPQLELKPINLPYDWTYTTDYMGSVSSATAGEHANAASTKPSLCQPTTNDLNITLLTQPDPILWYTSIPLYEDELHDNGVSQLTCKVRVMPQCWLILMQFYLRVDDVLVRLYETRYYYEQSKQYILRDHCRYEIQWSELPKWRLPQNAALLHEPHLISRKCKPQVHIKQQIDLR